MKLIPWILAGVAFIAFCASFSELQRMRQRFGEVSRHQFYDHQDVRRFIIRAASEGLRNPIVVLGDSIVEMAAFPATLCGAPVLNAGIAGATSEDILHVGPQLLEGLNPSFIVVAVGANDRSGTVQKDFAALLVTLKSASPRILVVPTAAQDVEYQSATAGAGVPFLEIPMSKNMMLDAVHFNAAGYRHWTKTLTESITARCAEATQLAPIR